MPDKKSSGKNTDESEAKKGGPMKFVMTGVICLVMVGVGFVVGGRLSGGASASAEGEAGAAEVVEEEPAPTVGKVLDLDAININLAEGRYLRVAVSLGFVSHEGDDGGGHGKGEEVEIPTAPATDVVLHTFTGRTMAELSTNEGREAARLLLLEGLEDYYHSEVITVYFTEFVMQ